MSFSPTSLSREILRGFFMLYMTILIKTGGVNNKKHSFFYFSNL